MFGGIKNKSKLLELLRRNQQPRPKPMPQPPQLPTPPQFQTQPIAPKPMPVPQPASPEDRGGRLIPQRPVIGSVGNNGMYYAGTGSSSAFQSRLNGTYQPGQLHTADMRPHYVTEDQFKQLFGVLPSEYKPQEPTFGKFRQEPTSQPISTSPQPNPQPISRFERVKKLLGK